MRSQLSWYQKVRRVTMLRRVDLRTFHSADGSWAKHPRNERLRVEETAYDWSWLESVLSVP